ncbi:MAG: hypothetical protein JNK05_19530 [Myxococcales bacterium]|nr:hypothetical protein [Myxococcales bacterium]
MNSLRPFPWCSPATAPVVACLALLGCSSQQSGSVTSSNTVASRVTAANDSGLAASEPDAGVAAAIGPSCESSVQTQLAAPARLPTVAEPTAAPVVRACAATARANRQAIDRGLARIPSDDRAAYLQPIARCYAAGTGAWSFEVTSATVQSEGSATPASFRIEVRPVFIDARGSTVRAAATVRMVGGPSPYLGPATQLASANVFDWDGDGVGELYFHEHHSEHEENTAAARRERWWTFTARGGSLREFSPLAARALRVEDVDGDRRPDFVLRSPWVLTGPCGISEVDFDGPTLLAQSLGDGTFSTSNDTALAYVSAQCRQRPSALFEGRNDTPEHIAREHPAFNIGCARFWNISADAITAAAERAYPALDEERARCWPKSESLRLARVDPPEAFRLECASR